MQPFSANASDQCWAVLLVMCWHGNRITRSFHTADFIVRIHMRVKAHIPAPCLLILPFSVAVILEGGSAASGTSFCPSEHRLLSSHSPTSSFSLFFFLFSFFFNSIECPASFWTTVAFVSEVLLEKEIKFKFSFHVLQTEWEQLYWAMKAKATAAALPAFDLKSFPRSAD